MRENFQLFPVTLYHFRSAEQWPTSQITGPKRAGCRTRGAGVQPAPPVKNQTPAGRFGNPSEIAKAVVFLAPDQSAFTIGSELVIDGGMSNR
jgi:NAD(P)-dependent dehydrogenase (short-subunit alcohol dehydrogenase family)